MNPLSRNPGSSPDILSNYMTLVGIETLTSMVTLSTATVTVSRSHSVCRAFLRIPFLSFGATVGCCVTLSILSSRWAGMSSTKYFNTCLLTCKFEILIIPWVILYAFLSSAHIFRTLKKVIPAITSMAKQFGSR